MNIVDRYSLFETGDQGAVLGGDFDAGRTGVGARLRTTSFHRSHHVQGLPDLAHRSRRHLQTRSIQSGRLRSRTLSSRRPGMSYNQ